MTFAVTLVLWSVALYLGVRLIREKPAAIPAVMQRIGSQALFVAPRLVVGMMGAGFYAVLTPAETMERIIGPQSGLGGALLAAAAGAVTPGGPVVGFAIAGALVGHAGAAQIITYITAWSLFSFNRSLIWEAPLMGGAWMRTRLLISVPAFLALVVVLLIVA
jgi:hypothetical protein